MLTVKRLSRWAGKNLHVLLFHKDFPIVAKSSAIGENNKEASIEVNFHSIVNN